MEPDIKNAIFNIIWMVGWRMNYRVRYSENIIQRQSHNLPKSKYSNLRNVLSFSSTTATIPRLEMPISVKTSK